jgi:diguanylate cyclase (GGDEF)-like protein
VHVSTRHFEVGTAVRTPLLVALGGVVGVAVLSYVVPPGAASRETLLAVVLMAAPLAALGACVLAALTVPAHRSGPWRLLCAAAALAVLGQLHRHTGAGSELSALHFLSNVAATALFAGAVGWLLRQRTCGRTLELALDAALVLTAVGVAALRWYNLDWTIASALPGNTAVFAAALAAGAAGVVGIVLVIARSEASGRKFAAAGTATLPLAVAGTALGISVLPLASMHGADTASGLCCMPTEIAGLAFVLGWLGLAAAGLRALRPDPADHDLVGTIAAASRARLVVAPLAALLMGSVALDSAVNTPITDTVAAGLSLLGILLAVRLSHLLFATRSYSAEQLELAHSVALIEVSHALSGTRQLDETLALVSRWAVRLLDGKAAVIELLMPDGETLELHAVYGLPNEMLGLQFPVEGSFTGWVVRHGRTRATENASLDPLLHAASVPYLAGLPLASVPLRYSNTTLGALSCVGRRRFTATDLDLLGAFADQAAVAIENARLFRQVHQLSITDPLTGLVNRRQLDRDLAREFAAARRGRRLIAVMFDVDRFKAFNDRHGHLAGDEALRGFAAALSSLMRTMNVAARFGGDEFLVLLADTGAEGAGIFIEHVRSSFPGPDAVGYMRELSVSAGYAEYRADMQQPEDLIAAADAALYLNKARSDSR